MICIIFGRYSAHTTVMKLPFQVTMIPANLLLASFATNMSRMQNVTRAN